MQMPVQTSSLAQFSQQNYLSIESFRKNGQSVKTPVWFVQDGDTLYVRTVANSGKVKRIRRNPQVNVAPCSGSGDLRGEWVSAQAREVSGEIEKRVDSLLGRKYGLQKTLFALMSALRRDQYAILEIKVSES
ncbi:MAG TPA: PPOX class F420-dependent oxidoreductase [Anaerolineaceae bacterium]